MNIVFYRYKSICEPDFIDAFKALGINVVEDNQGMDESLSLDERMAFLGDLIADNKPLFVFSINYHPFISMLCDRLHVFYVAITVDCPVFEIFNTSIKSKFNRLFLFDKKQYDMIHSENPECIFHMPLGAACERSSDLLGDVSGYDYDISFVGSLYKEKDPLYNLMSNSEIRNFAQVIDNAISSQLGSDAYGYETIKSNLPSDVISALKKADPNFYPSDMSVFDISEYVAFSDYLCPHATYLERVKLLNLIAENASKANAKMHLFTQSDTSSISTKVSTHGGVDSLKEMPFIFRKSKINLNITTRAIESGLSQRIWDVLACKGFLITNYQPEIDMFFKDGIHLVTYSSHDELIEKIDYYLHHEDERQLIAQNGFDWINDHGKVVNRVIEMIKVITSGGVI